MMNFIRQRLKFLMWFVAAFFVGGLFIVGGRSIGPTWLANILPVSLLVKVPSWARAAGIIMKVEGYNVKLDEFKRVRDNTIALARMRYKDNFDEYTRGMDFDKQALDSITKYAILLQEADRRNIYVSKAGLSKGIREFPAWLPKELESRVMPYGYYSMSKMRSGEFDPNLYKYFLAVYGKITTEDFSEEVENCLRIARLKDLLEGSVLVTDLEVEQEYRKQNEKARVKVLELRYTDFASKVEIDDAELNDFFEENILDYKTNDKVNIDFIKIDPKRFESGITITDAEIANYYKRHKEEDYFQPEKVKAEHILVSVDAGASEADKEKARSYAEEILVEAKKPEADFAALVEKYNKKPFEVKHEDLGKEVGFFERGKMVKPFEDAAFALSPGEVSDVVETTFGYHIIRLQDKVAEYTKPLEEVRDDIEKKLREEQAVVDARVKANDIWYTVTSEQDLEAAIDIYPELGLKIEETGLFEKGGTIPKIGSAYIYGDIVKEAFKLKLDEISDQIEVTSYGGRSMGHFIFKLKDKKPGGLPTLDEVKDDVTRDLRNEKVKKLAMEEARKIMTELGSDDDLSKIAEKNSNFKIIESEPFTFSTRGYISGKPSYISSREVMSKAFSMDVGEIAGPFEGVNSVYIIQLVERERPGADEPAEDEEKQKEDLREQLLTQKQRKIYDAWYQRISDKAVVTSFIESAS